MEGMKGMNAAMRLFDSNRKEEKDRLNKPKITVSSELHDKKSEAASGKGAPSLFSNNFEDEEPEKEDKPAEEGKAENEEGKASD